MKKGQTILVTSGSYSSYRFICLLETLSDFDPKEQMNEFKEKFGKTCEKLIRGEKHILWRDETEFIDWIISKGLVKWIPFKEMDVDSFDVYITECEYEDAE